MTDFVSLHNQTDFSILDSLISPKALLSRAKELGQSAISVTDHGTLAAAWDAFKASKELGIKLIIGCECYFQDSYNSEDKLRHIVLLAINAIGYKNLLILNKKGFDHNTFQGKRVYSVLDWNLLQQYSEGIICLTACGNGILSQLLMKGKFDEAERTLLKLKELFNDRLGIEIQPNNMKRMANAYNDEIDQQFLNRKLIELGKKHQVKIVPACNAHYLNKDDHDVHDVLLSIGSHQPKYSNFRLKYTVPDFYLKSGEEVKNFFSRNYGEEFSEEICANTLYFANMCENPNWIDPKYSNPSGKELPVFPVKDEPNYQEFTEWLSHQSDYIKNLSEDKSYLRFIVDNEFPKRLERDHIPNDMIQLYKDRIEKEFDTFETLDLSSYMLITADFLNFARKNNISVGPGRGSAGGSYVAYLLNIHEADSIKYDLVFERFHNKLKLATSDIDNDIAPSGRDIVIDYVRKKYGEDHVAHVSNMNRNTPKVYIKDIARACELGGGRAEGITVGNAAAECIPSDVHSIEEGIEKYPLFAEYCVKYPEFVNYKDICNKPRAVSTHAAGVIVAGRPLIGLVPLRRDKDGVLAIEYDKDKAEENGLVKIDFLGLKTLDIIDNTLRLVKESGKEVPEINVEEYDEKTYNLISSGNTFGVFQFGTSGGTIDLCKRIKPKSIEDLAIITTLARPASAEIRDEFISTREGKKPVSLLHESLENAFSKTFGYPLYDESLLILAKDVAGWDLGEADKLRKLTKEKGKNPAKAKKWKEEFIEGSMKNSLTKQEAENIWVKVVEPYGRYSFNKSHAVLYSMISYKTAYLKAHYPIEFLLANLMEEVKSNAPDAQSNIDKIKNELRANKVEILAPDINKSAFFYTIKDDNKLLTGLDALKFVGDDAIKDIIEKRPFTSFFDFMVRVDSKKVRANNIQALVASGAMDCFKMPRKTMFLYVSDYRKKLQVWLKRHDPTQEDFSYPFPKENEWTLAERFALEHFYMGEAFICRPASAYGNFFKDPHFTVAQIKKMNDRFNASSIKGIIRNFFEFKVKKETSKYYGQTMIKAVIEDWRGDQCGVTIFPDRWKEVQATIKKIHSKAVFDVGLALHFSGNVNNYEDEVGIIFDKLYNIARMPSVPEDLKAKKISLKQKEEKAKDTDSQNLLEQIEDSLYDQGLIDLDSEIDSD